MKRVLLLCSVVIAGSLLLACVATAQQPKTPAQIAEEAASKAKQAAARAADAAARAQKEAAIRAQKAAAAGGDAKKDAGQTLFDGKSLDGWKTTNFAGGGEVKVEKGQIIIGTGESLTGITWKDADKLPKDDYEVSLQAMKLKGEDFFCGLTFPVRDSHASFIVGGWAGTVVGLSSINGQDASENETTNYRKFDANKWYKIRVRVAGGKIECWIDDEKMVDVEIKDRRISTRIEVDPSRPLGVATYQVTAAIKDVQLKRLK